MKRKIRMIMVEDNPADARLNEFQLAEAGMAFEYRRVEKKEDFLRELEEFSPDIVLADYLLPGFEGLSVIRLIQERGLNVPVVIVTGAMDEEAAVNALKTGAADYVLKQRRVRLGPAVQGALERREMAREREAAQRALRESYDRLEERVRERTSELERLNATLKREIIERQRVEELLQRSERQYRELVESVDFIIMRILPRGEIVFINQYGQDFFGRPADSLRAHPHVDVLMPDGEAFRFLQTVRDVIREERKSIAFESDHRGAKGGRVWVSWTAIPLGEDPSLAGEILLSGADITDRKRAEDTLRRNEYEIRTLVENSPDIVLRFDAGLRYVYANPTFARLTGIPREDMTGRTNRELGMAREQTEAWEAAISSVFASGKEGTLEFDLSSLFGRRYFWARIVPEFAKDGTVDTAMVIARDITERKQAEEHVRYISFHDRVTGLYNRAYFEEEIRRIDQPRELPISIIMGDVNNLKLANDAFGHEAGDRLLKSIAGVLQAACRQNDVVARWGGDEFVVILPQTDRATAEDVAHRIGEGCRHAEDMVPRPSISLGIAVKDDPDQNIYRVLRGAEEKMYRVKSLTAQENREQVLSSLRQVLARRHPQVRAHIERMERMVRESAPAFGLSERQVEHLVMVADLHELGKISVPQDIWLKPGRLLPHEQAAMRKYTETSYRIARSFSGLAPVADTLLALEERWDGEGYPRGLSDGDIPLLARVFSIEDAFDVMTHARPYAHPLSERGAVEELKRGAGGRFDPGLVGAFVAWLEGRVSASSGGNA